MPKYSTIKLQVSVWHFTLILGTSYSALIIEDPTV
jgi:hypothetical protein